MKKILSTLLTATILISVTSPMKVFAETSTKNDEKVQQVGIIANYIEDDEDDLGNILPKPE